MDSGMFMCAERFLMALVIGIMVFSGAGLISIVYSCGHLRGYWG